jgi:hypothetical protein
MYSRDRWNIPVPGEMSDASTHRSSKHRIGLVDAMLSMKSLNVKYLLAVAC